MPRPAKGGDRMPAQEGSVRGSCANTWMTAIRCARWAHHDEKSRLPAWHLFDREARDVVANVGRRFSTNSHLASVATRARQGAVLVAVCAAIEAEISQLDEATRRRFSLLDLGLADRTSP